MNKKMISILVVCLLVFSLLPRASAQEEEYGNLLDGYEAIIKSGNLLDYSHYNHIYKKMMLDSSDFLEELAFRDAAFQQALIKGMARTLPDEQIVSILGVVKVLAENPTGPSQKKLIDLMTVWMSFGHLRCSYGGRTDYANLFREAVKGLDGGAQTVHENHLFASLMSTPYAFVQALLKESSTVRNAVTENLGKHSSGLMGNAILDKLDTLERDEDLTQTEQELVNQIRDALADTAPLPEASGPDPDELAKRNAEKEAAATQPTEPTPTETEATEPTPAETTTQPTETEPQPTEPQPSESETSGINGWVLLPVALAALSLGFAIGVNKREKKT